MKLTQLIEELDKLRRFAGGEASVVVRFLNDDDEFEPVPVYAAVQAVDRERTDDGVRIVLEAR